MTYTQSQTINKQIQIILQSTLTNYTTMLAMIIFYAYQFKVIISNVKERIFPTKSLQNFQCERCDIHSNNDIMVRALGQLREVSQVKHRTHLGRYIMRVRHQSPLIKTRQSAVEIGANRYIPANTWVNTHYLWILE